MVGKIIDVLFHAALLLVFFILLTPIGFVFKMLGQDFLSRRLDPNAPSYWISRKP